MTPSYTIFIKMKHAVDDQSHILTLFICCQFFFYRLYVHGREVRRTSSDDCFSTREFILL
jgi:hypothetical protein